MQVLRQQDFGVEIEGLDPNALTDREVAELRDLVYRRRLVVFRGLGLASDLDRYLAFARRFGLPQVYHQAHYHHPEHPEVFVSSNVPENGQKVGVAGTGRFWHTDYSFFEEPLSTTMVAPAVVPGERSTYFIDMVRVLEHLPDELRAPLEGRRAFHDATYYYKIQPRDIDRPIADLIEEFRRTSPGAWHPAVIEHPATGERALYVSEGFTTAIEGMSHEDARSYLPELFEFIGRSEHVHPHPWREGDVLFWDNRTLIHRASDNPDGAPSVSYRVGVYDDQPFYVGQTRGTPHTL